MFVTVLDSRKTGARDRRGDRATRKGGIHKKDGLEKIPPPPIMRAKRPDKEGTHKTVFLKNKKRIYATQDICGICGRPVDKSIQDKYHPMAPCIDHIIPVSKGGHPSDITNLQLAHRVCNRLKSNKIFVSAPEDEAVDNRDLPQSMDWSHYKYTGA